LRGSDHDEESGSDERLVFKADLYSRASIAWDRMSDAEPLIFTPAPPGKSHYTPASPKEDSLCAVRAGLQGYGFFKISTDAA